MKKALSVVVVGLSLFSIPAYSSLITLPSDPALAGAVTETFDSVSPGDYASLSLPGVTIVGNGSPMTVDGSWNDDYGKGGLNLHNRGGSPYSFDLIFDAPVSAFGIWGGAYNNDWVFSAYDAAGSLIESVTVGTSCCAPQFFGLADAGIKKVTLDGSGDWVIFDNLMFKASGVSQVPEPVSLALLGLGLAGIGFSTRKSGKAR